MDKKEYIMNQIKKTFGKKYENYCVNRIITLINRNDLKFVTQQLFKRKGAEIAKADLYFPQINLWIEIDEDYHKKNKLADNIRTEEIIENNKLTPEVKKKYESLEEVVYIGLEEPERIDVSDDVTIEMVNNQIDKIVEKVKSKIEDQGDKFVPWVSVNREPKYYINKGFISVSDNAKFKKLDIIAELFGVTIPYNDKMHAFFNVRGNVFCWCPTVLITGNECDNQNWKNRINDDGTIIIEEPDKQKKGYLEEVLNQNQIRYVFTKYKDETGEKIYKFKGVYELDREETHKTKLRIWKMISDKIELNRFQ